MEVPLRFDARFFNWVQVHSASYSTARVEWLMVDGSTLLGFKFDFE